MKWLVLVEVTSGQSNMAMENHSVFGQLIYKWAIFRSKLFITKGKFKAYMVFFKQYDMPPSHPWKLCSILDCGEGTQGFATRPRLLNIAIVIYSYMSMIAELVLLIVSCCCIHMS